MWKRWKIEIESAKANFESSTVVSLLQGHIHNVNSKQGTAKLISCVKTEQPSFGETHNNGAEEGDGRVD